MNTSKGPGRNKCPDCKGSGLYRGLNITPEPCQACGGAGEFLGVKVDLPPKTQLDPNDFPDWMGDHLDQISKNLDVHPVGTKKEDWRQLAKAFKKSSRPFTSHGVTEIKNVPKSGMSQPTTDLKAGEAVHVFDSGWFETVVDRTYEHCKTKRLIVQVSYPHGMITMPIEDVCWNITDDRWEYIRAGTPVW